MLGCLELLGDTKPYLQVGKSVVIDDLMCLTLDCKTREKLIVKSITFSNKETSSSKEETSSKENFKR